MFKQTTGPWTLREESRESWDNYISDEFVYFAEFGSGNLEPSHEISEKYLNGDCWFELHFTCEEKIEGETHFNCIVEVANMSHSLLPSVQRKMQVHAVGVHGNGTVFVYRPKFIQLPEEVISIGIPSVIRLKRVYGVCNCGWEQTEPIEVGGIPALENREMNVTLLSLSKDPYGVQVSQIPRELVKRRAQTTYEISQEHGNDFIQGIKPNVKLVDSLLKVCLLPDGVRFHHPHIELGLKCIKVHLRPAGFHFNIERRRDCFQSGCHFK